MSFWNKLFGAKSVVSEELPIVQPTKPVNPKKSELLLPLLESIKPLGHAENPLFRKEYDLHSRIPCTDFSLWLMEKFHNKNYETIWAFVKEFYGNDDEAGTGFNLGSYVNEIAPAMMAKKYKISIDEAKREWAKIDKLSEPENKTQAKSWRRGLFENFIGKDFATYISAEEKIVLDIKSFFILKGGMDDSMRGFWIGGEGESFNLAKVMSVYDFSINLSGFEQLIVKANDFLKEMKKEEKVTGGGDYWKSIQPFGIKDLKQGYFLKLNTDLRNKLQILGVGERIHFFDFASFPSFSNYWSGNSTYKTRSVGVCETESVKKMIELNLFSYTDDIESIPDLASKRELKENAERSGFELKKSWTLLKIYENLFKSEEGKMFLKNFVQEKKALKFNETYREDLRLIIEYQGQIKIVAQLLSMI